MYSNTEIQMGTIVGAAKRITMTYDVRRRLDDGVNGDDWTTAPTATIGQRRRRRRLGDVDDWTTATSATSATMTTTTYRQLRIDASHRIAASSANSLAEFIHQEGSVNIPIAELQVIHKCLERSQLSQKKLIDAMTYFSRQFEDTIRAQFVRMYVPTRIRTYYTHVCYRVRRRSSI